MSTTQLKANLTKTIEHVKASPEHAQATFTTHGKLLQGLRCETDVRDFSLYIDEPESLGGTDTAPNPVEMVLAALGACQEILYSAYGAMMGIPLQSVKVKTIGNLDLRGLFALDPAIPAGFTDIYYETTIVSPAPEEEVRKLQAIVEKHCPVMDTLARPIPIQGKVTIEQPAELHLA